MSMSHPNLHPDARIVTNAVTVAREMRDTSTRVARKGAAITKMYTMLLATKVKAHASGRPGPRVITGHFRRSIEWEFQILPGQAIGTVGTNAPQGRRLEYGFVGADRLGRVYNQKPYPSHGPALEEITPQYEDAVISLGNDW